MEKLKTFVIKSVEDESADFHFEAYASTYDNVDRDGDVMTNGCFDNTLKSKAVVPMCLNHDRNPFSSTDNSCLPITRLRS